MSSQALADRAVIESLRSGVPNARAVEALGTTQKKIESKFRAAISAAARGEGSTPITFEASFGQGKSHLLRYLRHLAEEEGFATTYVVVSPGVPLGRPAVVLKELTAQATVKGLTGRALRELHASASPLRSDRWPELERWAQASGVHPRFAALSYLYRASSDDEFKVRILDDIQGAPMLKSEITKQLKELGQASGYDLRAPSGPLGLAHDRIRLFARMLQAMGCGGLAVLVDELERIVTFSFKQRLAAYREVYWWKQLAAESESFIVPVFAYSTGAIEGRLKEDRQKLQGGEGLFAIDGEALEGVTFLIESVYRLDDLKRHQIEAIRYTVRDLYQRAYDVQVHEPDVRRGEQTIRQSIRYWITCWDLARYHPQYRADVRVDDVVRDERSLDDAELGSADEGLEAE